jgi:hypothetical protein
LVAVLVNFFKHFQHGHAVFWSDILFFLRAFLSIHFSFGLIREKLNKPNSQDDVDSTGAVDGMYDLILTYLTINI